MKYQVSNAILKEQLKNLLENFNTQVTVLKSIEQEYLSSKNVVTLIDHNIGSLLRLYAELVVPGLQSCDGVKIVNPETFEFEIINPIFKQEAVDCLPVEILEQ